MKYNTPELLLVGAAQNLVLGGALEKLDLNRDDNPETYSATSNPDSNSW